jgi:serine/threonine protein kinase
MKISNYNIINTVGEGGMATVFLAHDNKFDAEVAIKLLKKEFVLNDNIRKRFIAEARSMFKMSHPNIIKVTDLIEEGDTVAFVMEYVKGETLKEYINRKGKLKNKEIKNLFAQMLDALAYVHEQKLIHRDIKPSNFMVDNKGNVKMMDFGIAKNTDTSSSEYTQTGTSQSMGTPLYMSPEQIKSTKAVTIQSDIYSLGVVLWNMVTGRKPYDADTSSTFELQTKIVNEELPKTSTIFDAIIKKTTAKDLENRFKNCNEVKVKLANLQKQDNESTQAYTSQNSEKTIIETAADKTIVEKPKQPQILSPSEIKTPYNPPVEKSNFNIPFIILGIILITGLGIGISNKSGTLEVVDRSVIDPAAAMVDTAANAAIGTTSKTISFKNNSNLKVYLSYAFLNNTTWESVGWYAIEPDQSQEITLPESFSENSIFWYAEDSAGGKYESTDAYFCVDGEAFHSYNIENCDRTEGFYKLNLTGTYTEQGLGN